MEIKEKRFIESIISLKSDKQKLIKEIKDLTIKNKNKKSSFKKAFDNMEQNYERMKKEVDDWEREKTRIAQIQPITEFVELNVGGHKDIEVRLSTLTTVKGSALEAMFSGRHKLPMKNDRVFIDRDPTAFKLIIEFIQNNGKVSENHEKNMKAFN